MAITRRNFFRRAAAVAAACVFASDLFAADAPTTSAGKMLTRKIPSTGEELPVIGLGTWKGLMPREINEQTLAPLAEVIKSFFDAGGRVVDTAPSYNTAEETTGILAQKLGITDKLFLATKVLEHDQDSGLRSFDRSFQRLRRSEKLDLMQCHNFTDWPTQLKSMRKWKDDGKFRYIGVTHFQDHAHEELERIIRRDKVDFLQINYSIAEPHAGERLLPAAKDLGLAVMINRPFAAGGLVRSLTAKPLPDFAKSFADNWPAALLKWIIADEAVTAVLPATSNPKHVRDNLRGGFGPLPDADLRRRLASAAFA